MSQTGLSALHSRPLSEPILLLLTSAVAAVPLEKIRTGGTLVAALFFKEVFGEYAGAQILPVFVALSAFGNLMCVAFTADERTSEKKRSLTFGCVCCISQCCRYWTGASHPRGRSTRCPPLAYGESAQSPLSPGDLLANVLVEKSSGRALDPSTRLVPPSCSSGCSPSLSLSLFLPAMHSPSSVSPSS